MFDLWRQATFAGLGQFRERPVAAGRAISRERHSDSRLLGALQLLSHALNLCDKAILLLLLAGQCLPVGLKLPPQSQ